MKTITVLEFWYVEVLYSIMELFLSRTKNKTKFTPINKHFLRSTKSKRVTDVSSLPLCLYFASRAQIFSSMNHQSSCVCAYGIDSCVVRDPKETTKNQIIFVWWFTMTQKVSTSKRRTNKNMKKLCVCVWKTKTKEQRNDTTRSNNAIGCASFSRLVLYTLVNLYAMTRFTMWRLRYYNRLCHNRFHRPKIVASALHTHTLRTPYIHSESCIAFITCLHKSIHSGFSFRNSFRFYKGIVSQFKFNQKENSGRSKIEICERFAQRRKRLKW